MSPKKVKSGEASVEKPTVPRYFIEELALVDPRLKVLWHPKEKKYLIVSQAPAQIFKKGYVVEMIVQDEKGGFAPCDRRVLGKLLELKYDRDRNFKEERFLRNMDDEDLQKAKKAEAKRRLMEKDFIIKVLKLLRSKTFVLNGGK